MNLLLAVSHSSIAAHFLLPRIFPLSTLSHSAFGRTLHTSLRLLRRYWADLLSESCEIRVLCSKHPHWNVWYLFYSHFQNSTTQSTEAIEYWMTVSSREFLGTTLACSGLFRISLLCAFDIIEHCHEDDSIFKLVRFNALILQNILDLLENVQWRESWENIPLELNDCSIFDSLLNDLTFSPGVWRNLSRRVPLLSST